MTVTPPKPPAGLAARGKRLWAEVIDVYQLDPAELAVLEQLARTLDELARLNAAAAKAPVTVSGSRGQETVNPLFDQVLRHRKTVETLARSLALPIEGQRVGSFRKPHRKAAVQSRWRRESAVKARGA
jgi:hypothetical protein